MANIVFDKNLNKCLRQLERSGKRATVRKVRAAMAEAAMDGEIRSLERTHHGETRFQKAEKYELGDGYRLIVQLVDGPTKFRVFLFAGTHDEADKWLDNHRGYVWVKKDTDGTLVSTQVTSSPHVGRPPVSLDIESPISLLELPLLRDLSDAEWTALGIPQHCHTSMRAVTREDWETQSETILDRAAQLSSQDKALLLFDLCVHAYNGEADALHRRVELAQKTAHQATDGEAAVAMVAPINSETFIAWDENEMPPDDIAWEDWMLFLQPQQREFAKRDFRGPARLRGVSGSGKTCVAVHRARYLAIKYQAPVYIVTLTSSMQQLLDSLIRALCGAERTWIHTSTVNALATDVIQDLHPQGTRWYTIANESRTRPIAEAAAQAMRRELGFASSAMKAMDERDDLPSFLSDEIQYVRSRLRSRDIEKYLDAKTFRRVGRGFRLGEVDRGLIATALGFWESELSRANLLDYPGIIQAAIDLLAPADHHARKQRCVLVDEVQDLSQLEMDMLGKLLTPDGRRIADVDNGLFLVGDGAQTIYRRGFSLAQLGINVHSRSFTLKKNYRNTREILEAAYALIRGYEFADIDEDNIAAPTEPDFATRHGERPLMVRCSQGYASSEAAFVAAEIRSRLDTGVPPSQICVIGCSLTSRREVQAALDEANIPAVELRQDAGLEGTRVKISTIESAKGHEFRVVFIAGLIQGCVPNESNMDDLGREAARLYVAMTRSRDVLYLSYTSTAGTRPSQFLATIQRFCEEVKFVDGILEPIGE
jgi:superfamily I DNA/RNA helicase